MSRKSNNNLSKPAVKPPCYAVYTGPNSNLGYGRTGQVLDDIKSDIVVFQPHGDTTALVPVKDLVYTGALK